MYPTPTTQEIEHPDMVLNEKGRRMPKKGKTDHSLNLADTVRMMYPTPRASTAMNANMSVLKKMKYKGRLEEKVAHTMYPTPTVSCQMDVVASPETVKQNKSGWTVTRKKSGTRFGAKLNDVVNKLETEMLPTPRARDYKDIAYNPNWRPHRDKTLPNQVLKNNTHGGKLNADFVSFLMGYPTTWTKIESTE
jgi:hypothetical protein